MGNVRDVRIDNLARAHLQRMESLVRYHGLNQMFCENCGEPYGKDSHRCSKFHETGSRSEKWLIRLGAQDAIMEEVAEHTRALGAQLLTRARDE